MSMIVVFAARTICSSTRRRYLFRGLLHNAPRQEGADHCFRAMQVTDFQEGRAATAAVVVVFAVSRLTARSKRVGSSRGRSAGLAPFRIWSTSPAARSKSHPYWGRRP
jgi:hypothetical protein